jgi:hypothetical protein
MQGVNQEAPLNFQSSFAYPILGRIPRREDFLERVPG